MKKRNVAIIIIIFLSMFMIISINWLYNNFGHLTLSEIIFQLKVPMEGTNNDIIWKYLKDTLYKVIIATIIITILLYVDTIKEKIKKIFEKKRLKSLNKFFKILKEKAIKIYKKNTFKLIVALIILIISIIYIINKIEMINYIKTTLETSTLIEDEYVYNENDTLTFPENKRNLIYIFMESMEVSFANKENNGAMNENLIQEMIELSNQNVSFSHTDSFGGMQCVKNTQWTIAAMVAQTSGLPLKIGIEGNSYGKYSTFLNGVESLGEVLEKQGYKNYLTIGSEAEFGGRKNYFEQHGNYQIWDVNSAINEKRMRETNRVAWGFDDADLYKYSKERLLQVAKNNEPFNFTILTVDTHHVDGYFCELCQEKYNNQYKDVISCASRQVCEFVEWIKKQDFYENTTIVICGDHTSMQPDWWWNDTVHIDEDYTRTVYNCIINSAVTTENTKNRLFSAFDMYPTTLASIGVKINGDRLGLGTNLFSDKKTILERYGLEYVNNELEKTSKFYNKNFLYNE